MITVPSRVTSLIERLEAGEEPTQDELRRVRDLQALDVARAGEEFVHEMCAAEDAQLELFRNL